MILILGFCTWVACFKIFLTVHFLQKACPKCDGYGVQQCHVCEGQGKLIWEGKLQRMDPCPLCFGSCLEKVRFSYAHKFHTCVVKALYTCLCISEVIKSASLLIYVLLSFPPSMRQCILDHKGWFLTTPYGFYRLQCRLCGGTKMKRGIPPNLQTQPAQNFKKSWMNTWKQVVCCLWWSHK
jgi:hypothetical protein